MLRDIQELLMNDNQLSQKVMFNVRPKGDQDKIRLAKLLDFQGPDLETVKLLEDHCNLWLQNPRSIWERPSSLNLIHLDPQTQVVGYFLQTLHGDA